MKFVSLVSTGIDSPVATYLMAKYGEIIVVHADNGSFSDDIGFYDLMNHLRDITGRRLKIYIVPHWEFLSEATRLCKKKFICVLCKRTFLKYASEIAKIEEADAIVNGDSLGQVASQTLRNIRVEQYGVEIPVHRPLIGLDKNEIVEIARNIGTYNISIRRNTKCKAAPRHPATMADLDEVLKEEKRLPPDLVNNILKKSKIMEL